MNEETERETGERGEIVNLEVERIGREEVWKHEEDEEWKGGGPDDILPVYTCRSGNI